jgi:hypothetical protein
VRVTRTDPATPDSTEHSRFVSRPAHGCPSMWLWAAICSISSSERAYAFERAYTEGRWLHGSDGALCGSGWSKVEAGQGSAAMRAVLHVIDAMNVRSIADIPCGDGCFSGALIGALRNRTSKRQVEYIGVDIVPWLVERNRKNYEDAVTHFIQDDVVAPSASLPHAELVFSRQMLQHLCLDDALRFIRLLSRTGARFALLTTFQTSGTFKNTDIDCKSGGYRAQDLTKPPFSLPPPLMMFSENYPIDPRVGLGLWSIRALRHRML